MTHCVFGPAVTAGRAETACCVGRAGKRLDLVELRAGHPLDDQLGDPVTLLNTDQALPVRFERGDRIAQLVVQRVAGPQFHEVQTLPGSARGDDGFGSTGGHGGDESTARQ